MKCSECINTMDIDEWLKLEYPDKVQVVKDEIMLNMYFADLEEEHFKRLENLQKEVDDE